LPAGRKRFFSRGFFLEKFEGSLFRWRQSAQK